MKLKIKLNIAGRPITMSIDRDQEETIRQIGKQMNDLIKQIRSNYDLQYEHDALIMAGLQMITEKTFALQELEKEKSELTEKTSQVLSLLTELEK